MNEEMYEEEDDDLPHQYRRLTANLQTGSFEFNRKLAAYLTHNVAVRSALNQAINDSFAQQYPGTQQFPQNQNTIFPSPLNTDNLPTAFAQSPQATPTSPHPYRQTPYPMPGTPGFRGQSHKRVNSAVATGQDYGVPQSLINTPINGSLPPNLRRMSMPASTGVKPDITPETSKNVANSVTSSPKVSVKQETTIKSPVVGNMGPPPWQQPQHHPQQPSFFDFQQNSMSPLSMTLPPDTQQLLRASLPPNDPFSNILLGGNHPNNFFAMHDYMPNDFLQGGLNSTLAPNAHCSQDPKMGSLADPNLVENESNNLNLADFKGVHYAATTPGENSFDSWINDNWPGENT